MTDEEYERWLANLTLVGDEAYLPGEEIVREPRWHWRRLTDEERRHYHRDRARRRRANPIHRAHDAAKRRERAARRRERRPVITR